MNDEWFEVRLRFARGLRSLLHARARSQPALRKLAEKASAKDLIESCGVPHTEIDLILLDGSSVGFSHHIDRSCNLEMFGCREKPLRSPRLADPDCRSICYRRAPRQANPTAPSSRNRRSLPISSRRFRAAADDDRRGPRITHPGSSPPHPYDGSGTVKMGLPNGKPSKTGAAKQWICPLQCS